MGNICTGWTMHTHRAYQFLLLSPCSSSSFYFSDPFAVSILRQRSIKLHVFLFIHRTHTHKCARFFSPLLFFFSFLCNGMPPHFIVYTRALIYVYARVYIISFSFILYYYVSQQRAIKWRACTNKWSSKSVENMLVIDIAFVSAHTHAKQMKKRKRV